MNITFVTTIVFILTNIYLPKVDTNSRDYLKYSRIVTTVGLVLSTAYLTFIDRAPVWFKLVICLVMLLFHVISLYNYYCCSRMLSGYIYINKGDYEVEDYVGDDSVVLIRAKINDSIEEIVAQKAVIGKQIIATRSTNGKYYTHKRYFEFDDEILFSCLLMVIGVTYLSMGSGYKTILISSLLMINGLIKFIISHDIGKIKISILDGISMFMLWLTIILTFLLLFRK